MKKLRLDVDALRVESFDPAPARGEGVRAHELPTDPTCLINSCGGADSYCECTSNGGEAATCAASCRSEPCVCVPQG